MRKAKGTLYKPVTFVPDGNGGRTALRRSKRGAVFAKLVGGQKRYYGEKKLTQLAQDKLCRLAMKEAVRKYVGEFPTVKQAVAVAYKQVAAHYPQCRGRGGGRGKGKV